MSIDVKDFTLGTAKTLKSTLGSGSEHMPHHIVASPLDGSPLFTEGSFDAFSRLRISNPVTVFDIQCQYFINTRVWDTGLSVGGTATHVPNEAAIRISTGAATSANSGILQTKNYFRYQPGKSQLIEQTFVLGDAVENVIRRVGYFDVNNGVFLEQNSTTDVAFVVRSSTSGSPVDTRITQANWNLDKLNGTGASGIILDLSKAQIMVTSMQWLGVGSVEWGFVIDRKYVPAHRQNHANVSTTVYTQTANLPVRYEIVNAATAAGANTMDAICATVISEGGVDDSLAARFSAGNGATLLSTTTRRPVFSIRPRTTFNSIAFRGLIRPLSWTTFADANSYFELVLGGTLTGASFANVDTNNSAVEKDVAASSISGGVVIDDTYVGTASASARDHSDRALLGRMALSLDAIGTGQDVLTICATRYSGTTNCGGSIQWVEEK